MVRQVDVVSRRTGSANAELYEAERACTPLLLKGLVADWPAIERWQPMGGGIRHLEDLAGAAEVHFMASTKGNTFYGDIRSHHPVVGQFADILHQIQVNDPEDGKGASGNSRGALSPKSGETEGQQGEDQGEVHFYLAQAVLREKKNQWRDGPLAALLADISTPGEVAEQSLLSINLWMSIAGSRSSTHYDPYQNLLCVVLGKKRVKLWSPDAARVLYPMPLQGEASNHSAVDFVSPDLVFHPMYAEAEALSWTVEVEPGDALFIPEGWYHQVDSQGLTIAVNFWWASDISSRLGTLMDTYYARRIFSSLLDKEKTLRIAEVVPFLVVVDSATLRATQGVRGADAGAARQGEESETDLHSQEAKHDHAAALEKETPSGKSQERTALSGLSPYEGECVRELVLCAGRSVEKITGGCEGEGEVGGGEVRDLVRCGGNGEVGGGVGGRDLVASIFAGLEPMGLRRVLLAMVEVFPRSLEALILQGLTPVSAEILTNKLEAEIGDNAWKGDSEEGCALCDKEFYERFYAIFDNRWEAMSALLDKKEEFSTEAMQAVMRNALGFEVTPIPPNR